MDLPNVRANLLDERNALTKEHIVVPHRDSASLLPFNGDFCEKSFVASEQSNN
jgi:hypothetical protein